MIKTLNVNGKLGQKVLRANTRLHLLGLTGIKVKLQIWDTAGQERFRSITQSYYRSAHSLILVYDISSQPSFDSLPQWCRDIEHFAGSPGGGNSSNSSVVSSNNPSSIGKGGSPSLVNNGLLKVLVGNKCDKEREVPQYIAESFAEANNFHLFMETSALEAENVEKLFHQIASILVERSSNTSASIGTSNSNSNNNQPNRLAWASSNSNSKPNCVSCSFSF